MKKFARVAVGLIVALPLTAFAININLIIITANPVSVTATSGVATTTTLSASASNGDPITYSIETPPASGTLGALTDNAVDYTSNTGFTGTDTFVYRATDSNNSNFSTTATVTVTVSGGATDTTAPVITPPADQAFATTTFPAIPALTPATATDDTDPSPTVTYTPQTFSAGTTTVTWTATDASGNSAATTSLVVFTDTTPAAVPIHFEVETATTTVFNDFLTVQGCTTPNNSTATVNGFCAFDAAGVPVDVTWFSWGALINSIGGNSMPDHYWGFFLNGDYSQVGISDYILQPDDAVLWALGVQPLKVGVSSLTPTIGDTVTITVTGFDDVNTYSFTPVGGAILNGIGTTTDASGVATFVATSTDPVSFTVGASGFLTSATTTITASAAPASPAPAPSGGGGGGISHTPFNVPLALSYISSKQNGDGSFASSLLTDWAALAFAASDPGTAKTNLRNYILTANPSLATITDHERHAMALEALGINPYSGTPTDYITPIVNAFDGTQIGDVHLDNDDIFALFPLLHAGYTASDDIIKKTVAFVVSAQTANGSWDASTDMTAAAVQALSPLSSLPGVTAALTNAKAYLHSQQQNNGGFGNDFSTSWSLQAIAALGEQSSSWAPSGYYGSDYLAGLQQSDGGVEPVSTDAQTRVWATEYAIPGVLGKTWDSLLSSFAKPTTTSGNGGSVLAAATSTAPVATSTTPVDATSTPRTATSTAPVATTTETITVLTTPVPSAPRKVVSTAKPVTPAPTEASTTSTNNNNGQVAAAATATSSSNIWDYLGLVLLLLILAGVSVWARKDRKN